MAGSSGGLIRQPIIVMAVPTRRSSSASRSLLRSPGLKFRSLKAGHCLVGANATVIASLATYHARIR